MILLAACGDSRELEVLQAEPVVTAPVEGTGQGTTSEHESGSALGKPVQAAIMRRLPVLPGFKPDDVLREAVDMARRDGWSMEFEPPSGSTAAWLLRKSVNGNDLQLGTSISTEPGSAPTLLLSIVNLK